jgi:hypothetical protein
MDHSSGSRAVALFAAVFVVFALPAPAQLVLGQYEEEAPVRTWNSFPFIPAAGLGRGETAFAWPGEAAAVLANPALLFSLPRFTVALGGSLQEAAFLKYGPVNTGVFSTEGPVSLVRPAFDFAGLTVRMGRWAFGANANAAESYDRPLAEYVYEPRGTALYKIRFEQTGVLWVFNLSAGYRLGPGLSLGLGLNLVSGRGEKHFLEEWTSSGIAITDDKSFRASGFYLNGGLVWELSPAFMAAAVFRTPYGRKADRESRVGYQSPALPAGITIDGEAEDTLRQPLVLGIGGRAELFAGFRLGADLTYTHWPSYEVTWYGDSETREFRGALKAGAGVEYSFPFTFFGGPAGLAVRAGCSYDPQPMEIPSSSYLGATVGMGLRWRGYVLDFGLLLAHESGSGDGLRSHRAALSLGYGF